MLLASVHQLPLHYQYLGDDMPTHHVVGVEESHAFQGVTCECLFLGDVPIEYSYSSATH
jgi:hypothetical protein